MRVFISLVMRECARFLAVPVMTIFTPLTSAFLYVLIFGITMGDRITFPHELSYLKYIVSGLIIMSVLLHAFQNSTSSIIISKYRLNIVDTATHPIARHWLVLAFGVGGMIRGLVVGISIWLMGLFFVSDLSYNFALFLLSALSGGLLFSLLGAWLGFSSRNFDQISVYTSFIVTPILFLSGVFFPITILPEPWKSISYYNPIVYLVESARYGLTGSSELDLSIFYFFTPLAILVAWIGATRSLKKGVILR
jgi:ABC-2 type transport system permease protein